MLKRKWEYKDINLLFFFSVLSMLSIRRISDPDFFWHLKVGEWIINNKSVPLYDIFSYSAMQGNVIFYAHEWLFDAVLFGLYKLMGYLGPTLYLYTVTVINLYLMYKIVHLKTNKPFIAALTSFIYFPLLQGFFTPRPMLVSLAIFMTLVYVLEIYIRTDKNYLWLLPLFVVLLMNLHGGSIPMFFIIIIIYLIFNSREIQLNRVYMNKLSRQQARTILFYTLLSIPVVLLNPYGIGILKMSYSVMNAVNLKSIAEWRSIFTFKLGIGVLFNIMLPYVLLILTRERIKILDLMFVIMSTMLVISSARHLILFTVFNCISIGLYISDVLELVMSKLARFSIINTLFDLLSEKNNFYKANVQITTILQKSIASACILGLISFIVALNSGIDDREYPRSAIEYIKNNNMDIKNNIMFNDYNWGGYLIFNNLPVFIDGRTDIYLKEQNKGITIFDDYLKITKLESGWSKLLSSYKIKYALLSTRSNLSNVLGESDTWDKIYEDNVSVIYKNIQGEEY